MAFGRLCTILLLPALVLFLATSGAQANLFDEEAAASRLMSLGLVRGTLQSDGTVSANLGSRMTRAEAAVLIVRAFGRSGDVPLMRGIAVFSDVQGHWAAGEIAIAKHLARLQGHTLGMPDGTFGPDQAMSLPEAVAFLMKVMGVPPVSTLPWPANYLEAAERGGLVSAAEKAIALTNGGQSLRRGQFFRMADWAFSSYPLPEGKTVFTRYVDTNPPALAVDGYDLSTGASEVVLSGTVSGQATLRVGTPPAVQAVQPKADGTWQIALPLRTGQNQILVQAADQAGNEVSVPVNITRVLEPAARIVPVAPKMTIRAGGDGALGVQLLDASDQEMQEADHTVTVTGDVGTYDPSTRRFKAGTKPGKGKVTVSSGTAEPVTYDVEVVPSSLAKIAVIPSARSVEVGQQGQVNVKGFDQFANEVPVPTVAWNVRNGVIDNKGKVTPLSPGKVQVSVRVGGLQAATELVAFGEPAAVQLAPPKVVGQGGQVKTKLMAAVTDAKGNVVASYQGPVSFTVKKGEEPSKVIVSEAEDGVAEVELAGEATTEAATFSVTAAGYTTSEVNSSLEPLVTATETSGETTTSEPVATSDTQSSGETTTAVTGTASTTTASSNTTTTTATASAWVSQRLAIESAGGKSVQVKALNGSGHVNTRDSFTVVSLRVTRPNGSSQSHTAALSGGWATFTINGGNGWYDLLATAHGLEPASYYLLVQSDGTGSGSGSAPGTGGDTGTGGQGGSDGSGGKGKGKDK